MLSQEIILDALKAVKYPGYSRDIVSFGLVKDISTTGGIVNVTMQLATAQAEAAQQIKTDSEAALKKIPGVIRASVEIKIACPASSASSPSPAARAAWANPPCP